MSSRVLTILPMTDFDFSGVLTSTVSISDLPVGIPNVNLEDWTTGTLLVRIHALTATSSSSLRFDLKATAPTDEEPGKFFRGPVIATARINNLDTQKAPLVVRANYGGGGGVACSLFMSASASQSGAYAYTISVDLVVQDRPEAWSPADLRSLKLWLDQRDLAQVGGSYPSWGDQSAAGTNDFSQATGALQPTLFTSPTTNQWPAPSFNGSTQYMEGPTIGSFMSASAYHVFAVFNARTMSGNNATVTLNNGVIGDIDFWWGIYLKTGAQLHAVHEDSGGVRDVSTTMPLSTTSIVEWSFDGVTISVRVNDGVTATLVTPGFPVANVGNVCRIGNANPAGLFLDGRIASVIVCNAKLSAVDSLATRGYLSSKYGVPV